MLRVDTRIPYLNEILIQTFLESPRILFMEYTFGQAG